ncbi:MAG: SGNH/GDSL hydrolase family protein [Armatimonadota bacterium]
MSVYLRFNGLLVSVVMIFAVAASLGAATTFYCDNPNIKLSPYVWKSTGSGSNARAEATFPGAYFKAVVTGTSTIGVVIDGTGNTGCPSASMPVVEYSVDNGPFTAVPLTQTGAVYTFPVAVGMDTAASHKLEFYFRAADLGQNRWTAPTAHLRIVGVAVDDGGSLSSCPIRSKKAIGYGDSITEGVGVDGYFTSWQVLGPNNARGAWLGLVCAALDCEYGQVGSGGEGLVTEYAVPGLVTAWDHYDSTTSRLLNGLLLPEPDYLFCCHGNNDSVNIQSAYIGWLSTVRTACPNTRIFCIVPPAGVHRTEITAAVNARNQAGDAKVYLIDTPLVTPLMSNLGKATQGSYDGGHPTQWGQGMFGTSVIVKVQDILCR